MTRHYRLLLTLFLASLASACGIIESGTEIDDDTTAPSIIKVEPSTLANQEMDPNASEIRIYFSEPLNATSATNASNITITPSLDFSLSLGSTDSIENSVVIITLNETLPEGQSYELTIGTGIKDTSKFEYDNGSIGNRLAQSVTYRFTTPKSFIVKGTLFGLKGSIELSLTADGQDGSEVIEVSSAGEETPYAFSFRIIDGKGYNLDIVHLDTTEGFCAATNTHGTVNNQDVTVSISCDRVSPVFNDFAKWTSYGPTDSEIKKHRGAMRFLELPDTVTSCDTITADDVLGAFSWVCEQRAADSKFIVHNGDAEFQDGKGLSTLIDFPNLLWKQNRIRVYDNGSEITVDSKLARWWNNPIYDIVTGNNSLDELGAIYVARNGQVDAANIVFAESHISLLTEPGFTLTSFSNGTDSKMIYVSSKHYLWIEGTYDSAADTLLDTFSSRNLRIHNASFNGSSKGSTVSKAIRSRLSNVSFSNSGGDGLTLVGDGSLYGYVTLDDVVSVNHQGMGLNIVNGDRIFIDGGLVANNGSHGIRVEGAANSLNGISVYANKGDGVLLQGARNSFFAGILSSSNDGAGLNLKDTTDGAKPTQYNYLTNITLADNKGAGFGYSSTSSQTNTVENIIDGFNGTSTDCSSVDSDCYPTTLTNPSNIADFVGATGTTVGSPSNITYADALSNVYSSWHSSVDLDTTPANGACASGSCQVVDWSLAAAGSLTGTWADTGKSTHEILFKYNTGDVLPTGSTELEGDGKGNDDGSCDVGENCLQPISYLQNSIEVMGDGVGNDNNLCETGETCIAAPNAGAYQGHGTLDVVGTPPADPANITLKTWSTNGY